MLEAELGFIDDWDAEARAGVVRSLRSCAERGGAVLAATERGTVAGFASLEPDLFGPADEYAELTYLHVSAPYRGKGIGRKIIKTVCLAARGLGARRVYVGAHPAVETQAFYKRMGCRLSEYVHEPVWAREPLDLQLELVLDQDSCLR